MKWKINNNNKDYIKIINDQNDKTSGLETKFKDSKLLAKEILNEAGKMINKLEEDRLEDRGDYFRELFRGDDLYRQLGEVRNK